MDVFSIERDRKRHYRPGMDFVEDSLFFNQSFWNDQVVSRMAEAALAVPGISRVLFDLTAKPPATTEWE